MFMCCAHIDAENYAESINTYTLPLFASGIIVILFQMCIIS